MEPGGGVSPGTECAHGVGCCSGGRVNKPPAVSSSLQRHSKTSSSALTSLRRWPMQTWMILAGICCKRSGRRTVSGRRERSIVMGFRCNLVRPALQGRAGQSQSSNAILASFTNGHKHHAADRRIDRYCTASPEIPTPCRPPLLRPQPTPRKPPDPPSAP